MNTPEAVERLYQFGHFRHPAMPDNWNVGPAELELLQADDRRTRDATASFQQFFGLPVTGDIGPAELELLNAQRCGCPDYPDPTAAVGSGSWGMPCQKEGVTISYDLAGCPYVDWWDEIIDDCIAAYRARGLAYMRAPAGKRGNIHITFPVLPGSTIGLAEYNSQSCGDQVFCKLDPGYRPNKKQVKGLLLHELGHNDNLNHQNRGSDEGHGGHMHPKIREIIEWKGWDTFGNDPSLPYLRRYHGGDPIDPIPGPGPGPGPQPKPVLSTFTLLGKSYEIRESGGVAPGPPAFPG